MFGLLSKTARKPFTDLEARKAAGAKITATEYCEAGFSLIELIVVVAILGILVVIAIPIFSGIQKNARENSNATSSANAAISIAAALEDGDPATTAESTALILKKSMEARGDKEVMIMLPQGVFTATYNNSADNVKVRVDSAGFSSISGSAPTDPTGNGSWREVETGSLYNPR